MEVFAEKLAHKSFYDGGKYLLVDLWHEIGDQRVRDTYWLIQNGTLVPVAIVSAYLLFCLAVGPWLMRSRAPYSLKGPMLVYNLTMAVANLYFFIKFIVLLRFGLKIFDFNAPKSDDYREATIDTINLCYYYLLSKYLDFFDSFFFVLRKKNSQLNFLHLYHHSSVAALGTLAFILYPTLQPLGLFILLNSLIHTLMYSYYGLSALGPWMQPYLWWKRYITQIQIVQFVIYILYSIPFIKFQTGYSSYMVWLGWSQCPLFLYLFVQFYFRTYQKRSAQKLTEKAA